MEDRAFKQAFSKFQKGGGYNLSPVLCQRLSTHQAKLKKKEHNVAGLQLADLLAHALTRDTLASYQRIPPQGGFGQQVVAAATPKYRRSRKGEIQGYGRAIMR